MHSYYIPFSTNDSRSCTCTCSVCAYLCILYNLHCSVYILDAWVHASHIWHFHLSGNGLVPSETDNWGSTVLVFFPCIPSSRPALISYLYLTLGQLTSVCCCMETACVCTLQSSAVRTSLTQLTTTTIKISPTQFFFTTMCTVHSIPFTKASCVSCLSLYQWLTLRTCPTQHMIITILFLQNLLHLLVCHSQVVIRFHLNICTVEVVNTSQHLPHFNFLSKVWLNAIILLYCYVASFKTNGHFPGLAKCIVIAGVDECAFHDCQPTIPQYGSYS